jgi:hypothetical protein
MMKKVLLLAVVLVLVYFAYVITNNGIHVQNIVDVSSYYELENKSGELNSKINVVKSQTTTQFEQKKAELKNAVQDYDRILEEYQELKPKIDAAGTGVASVDLYDIDFLWTILGNYATEEGVILQMDVLKSSGVNTADTGEEFMYCDLDFVANGQYLPITNFIYDIEDDDRLGFEINDFKLVQSGESLAGTFIVKNVPLNSKIITELTKSDSNNTINVVVNTVQANTTTANAATTANTTN